MINITLADGKVIAISKGSTALDVAKQISASLLKIALYAKINGKDCDLKTVLTEDCKIEIITTKNTEEALAFLRHDTAHILAQAIKELFPDTAISIGPSTANGFYYDVDPKTPFQLADLKTLENRMEEIINKNYEITREVWNRKEAIEFFKKNNEPYKVEIIEDLPESEVITIYKQGNFIDLCRGPHYSSTGLVSKHFKLMSLAGAYWRGDSTKKQLQRIYGTAFFSKDELNEYLNMLEEAEKRDHKKLGREMELFHFQEEATGSVFWHPNGWTLYRALESYMRRNQLKNGYVEVKTPMLMDKVFWEKSGHWDKYRENMFMIDKTAGGLSTEGRILGMKPMNCPGHVQVFNLGIKSYRDLPIRMAEFGSCHRYESSGSLNGLLRVRSFVQDDGHIFCRESQIVSETQEFCKLLDRTYKDIFGEDVKYTVKFSDRPKVRAGTDEVWDAAEQALREAGEKAGLNLILNSGEGAFYGPKLEFVIKDAIGRDWQLGTLQVDFVLPERLNANYINENGEKQTAVMLHRAILGSFERFIGILIENYAGKFPMWLTPIQVAIATITSNNESYATEVDNLLKAKGLRTNLDIRNEKIPYKVRDHSMKKVPVIIVIGEKEREERTVSIRRLGSESTISMKLEEAIELLHKESMVPDSVN